MKAEVPSSGDGASTAQLHCQAAKEAAIETPRPRTIAWSAKLWGLRISYIVIVVVLPCALAGSPFPGFAFALASGPNGLFLSWFMRGALRLPHFLVRVRPMEPLLYRWVGVGLVKRIVATRMWPLMNGFEPPPKPMSRQELLDRTELSTKGAEVCHGATFLFVFFVAMFSLAFGRLSEAAWLLAFNMLLNGYPVMLQRANRWRVQRIRASAHRKDRLSHDLR